MITMIVFKFFAILFNTLDYVLTMVALKEGAREANPLARYGLKRFPKITCFIKVVLFNLFLLLTSDFLCVYIATLMFGWVCIHNTRVIFKRREVNALLKEFYENEQKDAKR